MIVKHQCYVNSMSNKIQIKQYTTKGTILKPHSKDVHVHVFIVCPRSIDGYHWHPVHSLLRSPFMEKQVSQFKLERFLAFQSRAFSYSFTLLYMPLPHLTCACTCVCKWRASCLNHVVMPLALCEGQITGAQSLWLQSRLHTVRSGKEQSQYFLLILNDPYIADSISPICVYL